MVVCSCCRRGQIPISLATCTASKRTSTGYPPSRSCGTRSITVGLKPYRLSQYARVGPAILAPEMRMFLLVMVIMAFTPHTCVTNNNRYLINPPGSQHGHTYSPYSCPTRARRFPAGRMIALYATCARNGFVLSPYYLGSSSPDFRDFAFQPCVMTLPRRGQRPLTPL